MDLGKKAALMAATAGALVAGGAGGASAYGFGHSGAQINRCDSEFISDVVAPVGPVIGLPPHSDCVNIGKGTVQVNDCDTTFISGVAFAPVAPVKFDDDAGSQCANISLGDRYGYGH
jgi:hypothetical protein